MGGQHLFRPRSMRRSPRKSVGVLSPLFNVQIGGHEQSNFTEPMPSANSTEPMPSASSAEPMPSASSAEPMPSASSEPSDRAAHSATTVQNLLPSSPGSSSDMFADQLEERVTGMLEALPRLREIETNLLACRMEIANYKNLDKELEKILPFSDSWWLSWTQHNGVSVTENWLVHSQAYLPFLEIVHKFKRLLQSHTQLLLTEVVSQRPLHCSKVLSRVKCIVATTDAFLKWKAGLTKGMIGQTVEKVAARSEGVLLDEVEALDVMQAVAALNERFKTCIFVGDENQKLERRGTRSLRPFALAIGPAHSAASQNDVENDVQLVNEEEEEEPQEEEEEWQVNKAYKPQERGVTDFLKKGNGNIENLSGLTLCKRCGPAITSFLSALLAPMRRRFQVQRQGACNEAGSHNVLWLRVVVLGAVA